MENKVPDDGSEDFVMTGFAKLYAEFPALQITSITS